MQWAKNHEHNGSPIEWDEDIPESVAMTVFNTLADKLEIGVQVKVVKK